MKAMALTGIRQMEMMEILEPSLVHSHDVIIRIEAVGVCGSDVHYYKTGRIGSQVVQYPFRVGHECAGTVVETGQDVHKVKAGDLVAIEPAISCGNCDQCLTGRPNTCRNLSFLGTPGQGEGSLVEYLVMPEECCFPLQETTPSALGTLAESLAIGVYAVQLAELKERVKIGILGFGPIGMSVLFAAQAQDFNDIYVTDKINERLQMAIQAGAGWTGNPNADDTIKQISEREPLLLDAVFECCGQQDALDQAIDLLKPGGKLVLVGIPEVDRISFVIDKMRRKEISLQNVRRQRHCMQTALDLVENDRINVLRMITHQFTFEQTKKAFDLVEGYREGVMKAVIILNNK